MNLLTNGAATSSTNLALISIQVREPLPGAANSVDNLRQHDLAFAGKMKSPVLLRRQLPLREFRDGRRICLVPRCVVRNDAGDDVATGQLVVGGKSKNRQR